MKELGYNSGLIILLDSGQVTEVCRLVVQWKQLTGSTSQWGDWISTPVCVH